MLITSWGESNSNSKQKFLLPRFLLHDHLDSDIVLLSRVNSGNQPVSPQPVLSEVRVS